MIKTELEIFQLYYSSSTGFPIGGSTSVQDGRLAEGKAGFKQMPSQALKAAF